MRPFILFFCLVLSHLWISPALADDNTCWIQAPDQNNVWVIIYDADGDGNRGRVIWEGKIASGQKVEIQSTDGHIRSHSDALSSKRPL